MVLSLKKDVNIKFSIIIPAHNVGEYLRATIESALSQTYRNIEVICVDDASTDNTKSIIEEFVQNDARVHGVFSEKNGGCVSARKQGIEKAKGDYILFLDGDDELAENACESLLPYLLGDDTPDILQFSCLVSPATLSQEPQSLAFSGYANDYALEYLSEKLVAECFVYEKFPHNIWAKVFKAEILKTSCMEFSYEHMVMADDCYMMFLALHYATSYRGVRTEPLYRYNFGRGVTAEKSAKALVASLNKQLLVLDEVQKFLDKHDLLDVYDAEYRAVHGRLCRYTIDSWRLLAEPERLETLDSICEAWGAKEILLSLRQ